MQNDMGQRPPNARPTGVATVGATPAQRPPNGGETLSPYPYGVAPAPMGWAHAFNLVPMPRFLNPPGGAGVSYLFALCGSGVAR